MAGSLAVDTASPLWRRMMLHLKAQHGARPLDILQAGEGPLGVEVDTLSGLLPVSGRGRSMREWFLPGTAPTVTALAWFDRDTGKPALPEAYAKWVASKHNHLAASLQAPAGGGSLLQILSPTDGLTYVIDSDLPASQQSLELKALSEAGSVQWTINGETHEDPHWPLQPGQWTVVARGIDGSEAQVEFSVE